MQSQAKVLKELIYEEDKFGAKYANEFLTQTLISPLVPTELDKTIFSLNELKTQFLSNNYKLKGTDELIEIIEMSLEYYSKCKIIHMERLEQYPKAKIKAQAALEEIRAAEFLVCVQLSETREILKSLSPNDGEYRLLHNLARDLQVELVTFHECVSAANNLCSLIDFYSTDNEEKTADSMADLACDMGESAYLSARHIQKSSISIHYQFYAKQRLFGTYNEVEKKVEKKENNSFLPSNQFK